MFCRRKRFRRRGRPFIIPCISSPPNFEELVPKPIKNKEPIFFTPFEYEALRLVDYDNLTFEEAAKRMNVSRGTIWRLVNSARKKIITAMVEQRPIKIQKEF